MNALFQCPETKGDLKAASGRWKTDSGVIYPVVGDIPWLVRRPEHLIAEWQTLTQQTLAEYRMLAAFASAELQNAQHELTRRRVQKLASAYADQVTLVEGILKPLIAEPLNDNVARALQKILPSTQKLMGYSANIFRDWSWGEQENKLTQELVREVLPASASFSSAGTFLFLGCGSGRFLYDVHRAYRPARSIGLDINPILLAIAQKLVRGGELSLWEFPLVPISSDKAAVLRSIKAPAKLDGDVQFALADVAALPIADKSVDVVFTPWLIDILPYDTAQVIRSVHQMLKPGGTWIQLGPLGFRRRHMTENLCADELVSLANANGFTVDKFQIKFLPYNQSPADSHHRMELVTAFAATRGDSDFSREGLRGLPPWIEDPSQSIPKLKSIEASLFVHRLYAEVLGFVDGKNSIESIATLLNTGFQLDMEQALGVTRRFFRSAWEAEMWE